MAVFPRRRIVEYDLVVLAEDRPEVRLAHLPGAGRPALIVVSSIAITELERTEAHCASKIGFNMSMERLAQFVSDDRLIVIPAASRRLCWR